MVVVEAEVGLELGQSSGGRVGVGGGGVRVVMGLVLAVITAIVRITTQ